MPSRQRDLLQRGGETTTEGAGQTSSLRLGSRAGRRLVAASVLGSGAVFLEGTVVNVALPSIERDFGLGMTGLQWVLNGYLLSLSALMLLGGSLGDAFGRRRVFVVGGLAFAAATAVCALAPGSAWLIVGRVAQGCGGALLVPNSLAMLEATFREEDRGAAIGQWAGWSGASTALGPFLGGWLVDAFSWRWVFLAIAPFAVAAAIIGRAGHAARTPVASAEASSHPHRVDYAGAALVSLGLAGVTAALVEGARVGFGAVPVMIAGAGGVALLGAFLLLERRAHDPLLPLSIFRSRQFTGANLATLLVYAALGGVLFLLMLQLQDVLGYNALLAGCALLPLNVLLLLLSTPAGRWAHRIGARLPISLGALTAGIGVALLARVQPGASYLGTLLPALVVFGLGLGTMVAPLTAAVLAAVPQAEAGLASAVNNAAARLAGLLAIAVLPLATGLGGLRSLSGPAFSAGFVRAMWICAALCAVGACIAFLTIAGRGHPTRANGERAAAGRSRPAA
jgi:EmrB/QacA subfamily drug resistance transporter